MTFVKWSEISPRLIYALLYRFFISFRECVRVMMASLWAKTGNLDDLLTVVHDCNK